MNRFVSLAVPAALALALTPGCSEMAIDEIGYGRGGLDDAAAEEDEDSVFEDCDDAPAEAMTFFVSADDSNSQALPVLYDREIRARGFTDRPVRLYEFLNYYSFDFEPGDDLRLRPELRRTAEGEYSLLVAVVGPDRAPEDRRPLNLTFSLDLSGSMGSSGIAGMQNAMRAISSGLREGDVVSAVAWDTSQSVLLDSRVVQGPDDPELARIIGGLSAGGGTDLDSGLQRAYAIAASNWSPNMSNRVVLISDGGANVGTTSATLIGATAEDGQENQSIYLAAIGTGDVLEPFLDEVTDLGKGAYLIIDSATEAERVLGGDRLAAVFDIAAENVQLEVTLPAGVVIEHFSGEEIDVDPSQVRPQHLSPNDAMLYHFDLLDCAGEGETGTVRLSASWTDPVSGESRTLEGAFDWADLLAAPKDHVEKADAIVRYARIASGEALQPQLVFDVSEAHPQDQDLVEIAELTRLLGSL